MEILDSGERREFASGAVRDITDGKGRCDLLPLFEVSEVIGWLSDNRQNPLFYISQIIPPPRNKEFEASLAYDAICSFVALDHSDICTEILEVSKHFADGCRKYGERNWEKGIPAHCYIDSAVRHYLKWERGDDDEPHGRAFLWNMLCFVWTIRNKPECYDLPPGEKDGNG